MARRLAATTTRWAGDDVFGVEPSPNVSAVGLKDLAGWKRID
jgi:hypothetical protein